MHQPRLQSIDALRGLAMILMALDHVRDFNHNLIGILNPEDLSQTTPALFFTRWVTHFCAPIFLFTAGVAAFFWQQRHQRTRAELGLYLANRGLWLIVLELTLMRFVISLNLFEGPILLVVLWALGCSMLALALLARLPVPAIAAFSLAMVAFHNLIDNFRDLGSLWNILHQQGAFTLGPLTFIAAYPLIPWIGVMGAGYCYGTLIQTRPPQWHLRLGLFLTLGFLALRSLNLYGDPLPWDGTALSFIRCTKYPPSLAFLLMTLGPALVLLICFSRINFSSRNPLVVFGRTPLFYFFLHLYLARLISVLHPGVGLLAVHGIWLAVVAMSYPLCLWLMQLKQRRKDWWLAYL